MFGSLKMAKRILILRPDHLGDLILFSGALEPIRARWPAAEITLCAPEFARSFLEHCPFIDRFLSYQQLETDAMGYGDLSWLPRFRGRGRVLRALKTLGRPLRRRKYACDVVLLPLRTPLAIYHDVVNFIPAARKLGIASGGLAAEFASANYSERMPAGDLPKEYPELEINRKFLEFLGCKLKEGGVRPQFWTTGGDADFAREHLKPDPRGIMIGLTPGVSSGTKKQLSPAWYGELFKNLADVPCQIIAFGTAGEKEYCQTVLKSLAVLPQVFATSNLAGQTTVRQLVECIRLCDVCLSQDTAALHMAVALGKPVAGIVGGAHFGRFFPWGSPERVHPIYNKLECFGCDWVCKFDLMKCLHEIPPLAASQSMRAAIQCAGSLRPSNLPA